MRLRLDVNVNVGGSGGRWQAVLNLTSRPFGNRSPLYVGIGAGISKRANVTEVRPSESLAAHHVLLAGLSLGAARLRPFVEAQVFDPLQPSRTAIAPRLGLRYLVRVN